jgi:uncharacterized SAM-binding protein YcdF (DUF218 family)
VWLLTTFLLSFSSIRGIVAYPLYVHDSNAKGEAAYVMADGYAYLERLRTASDLYHMNRVPQILLANESQSAGYNFTKGRSETRVERAIDYLTLHGVPRDKISTIDFQLDATYGSLSEARNVAAQQPDIKQLVVVTSAPHTRRSRLCFRRAMPSNVVVNVYSATSPRRSAEISSPIWVEYLKLLVYFFVA